MGQTKSKNLVDIVNDVSASVIMNNVQNCSSVSTQTQNISNSGWLIGVSQSSTSVINLNCASSFQMNTDIANQIANAIAQEAKSQNIALLGALNFNSAENIVNIASRVNNTITTSLVQNTLTSIAQAQNISGIGVGVGISQTIDATTVQSALADAISRTNLATSIANDSNQSASAETTNPLSFITDSIWIMLLFVVIIIGAILGVLWLILSD